MTGGIALFCWYQPSKAGSSGSALLDSVTSLQLPFAEPYNYSWSVPTLALGMFLIVLNLGLDGFTNNEQDYIFKNFNVNSFEMMQNVDLWQSAFLLTFLLVDFSQRGDVSILKQALECIVSSSSLRMDLLAFLCCASIGKILIFKVMEEFGSLTWITISVTRKMFTIVLSVFIYKHKFNDAMWLGVVVVFAGLAVEVYGKYFIVPVAKTAPSDGTKLKES